ncbi:hypothetical protein EDC94DRAFT_590584 [Helicostylum pulchrum]|nr:hypothetical protein EDC94DRAFT_590584 [Helicostylum pulchrum]
MYLLRTINWPKTLLLFQLIYVCIRVLISLQVKKIRFLFYTKNAAREKSYDASVASCFRQELLIRFISFLDKQFHGLKGIESFLFFVSVSYSQKEQHMVVIFFKGERKTCYIVQTYREKTLQDGHFYNLMAFERNLLKKGYTRLLIHHRSNSNVL